MLSNNESNFDTKIKKHLTLVLGMIGMAAVFLSGIAAVLPVQVALSDHTADDVDCNSIPCVHSVDIVNGAVGTADLAGAAVTGPKIATNAVTTNKIANGAVGSLDLGANSVLSSKIVDGSITKADVSTSFIRTIKYLDDATGNAAGWNPDGTRTNFSILSGTPTNNDSIILTSMNNAGFNVLGTFTQGCYVHNWESVDGVDFFDLKCVSAPPNGSELNVAVINQ